MNTLTGTITQRIQALGQGSVFANRDFLDLGSRAAVDQALSRLTRRGDIRRLRAGIYDYPRQSRLGQLSPDPAAVAAAISKKSEGRLLASGAYAANLLGISTQVPARIVYYTDGDDKRVAIGNQIIELRHAGPRRMAGAGKVSGLVIQALRYIGKDNVGPEIVDKLRNSLTESDRSTLKLDILLAADWMRPILLCIAD